MQEGNPEGNKNQPNFNGLKTYVNARLGVFWSNFIKVDR